ncbi:putative EG45-like domain containing protein 1 [Tripterygium wilfordii]|uniref:Putative EG45-like domain containing protein 1 n=1 Tax=Tripterygium wilfordii TaxID=458696 RepID=A0A7J7BWC2_TRIWF|nr:putative EG45-like domain containing protein 1 [Tripterygium wilfordii]
MALFSMSFPAVQGYPAVVIIGYRYAKISDTDTLWRNGAVCGKHYKVTCTAMVDRGASPCIEGGPSVTVTIAGICHNCPAHILMTQESFAFIAKPEITHNLRVNLEE